MKYQIVEWDSKEQRYSKVLEQNLTWDEATGKLAEIRQTAKPAERHIPRTIVEHFPEPAPVAKKKAVEK